MTTIRLLPILTRAAAVGAVAALGVATAATPLAAQSQRALFAWSGRVDREVLLVMRRGGVETRGAGGYSYGEDRGRLRVGSTLPRSSGYVNVRLTRGRGSADVVQQPNAGNDYTAVVRLRDDQSGAADYQVTALWQPANGGTGNGGYDRDGDGDYDRNDRRRGSGWGWGRDRDDDGRSDRDERRDRRRDQDNDGYYEDDRNNDRGDGRNSGGWGGLLGRTGNASGGSGVLRWSGRVDDVQEIRIRGRRASTSTVRGNGASDVRTSVSGAGLPARDARVRVRTYDGRGSVRVVEQPSARNNYTAVVRIEDRDGGSAFYDFEASWY